MLDWKCLRIGASNALGNRCAGHTGASSSNDILQHYASIHNSPQEHANDANEDYKGLGFVASISKIQGDSYVRSKQPRHIRKHRHRHLKKNIGQKQ